MTGGGVALTATWGAAVLAGALLSARGNWPLRPLFPWRTFFLSSALSEVAAGVLAGNWLMGASGAVALAVFGRDFWNRRGRRAAKALGARGRAVIAGLVEKVREAGSSVPQGARA